MEPRLKVSSNGLVKPGIEPVTPGLQGKRFVHYTTAAPIKFITSPEFLVDQHRFLPDLS